MPTIEITDEQYKFLKEAQQLLKTQNCRSTQDPFYCIMKKERVWGFSEEYASEYQWCRDDTFFKTTQDLYDDVVENFEKEIKEYVIEYYDIEGEADFSTLEKSFIEDIDNEDFVFDSFLEDHDYFKVYYNDRTQLDENSNIWSLFEVDALEYINSKCGTDSKIAYSYACSSWRSSRMNKVREFIQDVKL